MKFVDRSNDAIFVTGASTGIGRCTALHLVREGYTVFAAVRDESARHSLLEASDGRLKTCFLDITDHDGVLAAAEMIAEALEGKSSLYALVNNAGITVPGSVEFVPLQTMRKAFEVNLIGQLAVTQAFLPLIRKGRGRIIQVSSALGMLAMPLAGPYAASKFAIEGLTDALRRELRPWGIHVVLIEPGSIQSAIWGKIDAQIAAMESELPPAARDLYGPLAAGVRYIWDRAEKTAIPPVAVARAVSHALASRQPRIRYAVGWDSRFLRAVSTWVPARVVDLALGSYLRRTVRG